MRKRVLSLLLAMIMIFSLMPNVFAAHSNTDTGDSYIPLGGSVGGWGDKAGNHMGMRFSLYFAEGNWSSYEEMKQAESNNQLVWEKKGKTLDVVQKGMDNVTMYSGQTVYYKMNTKSAMDDHELISVDWSSTAVQVSNIPTPDTFPTILYDDSNTDKKKWQTYFCGYDKDNIDEVWNEKDDKGNYIVHFENLDPILNLMTKDLGWQNIDFRNGRYTTNSGVTKKGVFKLYFEPTTQITINNVSNAMTLRDLIAFYNSHKNLILTGTYEGKQVEWPIYTAFRSLSLTMANATRLSEDEPAINMNGYTKEEDIKSNSNFSSDGDLYKSGGVGVLTGFPRGKSPEVKVVTSYIKITGYNEKGEAIYVETEKAEDTKVEMVEPDAQGRIKIVGEKQKGATQYKLNDVFVTQKDIVPNLRNSESKEVEWLNTMPENVWTKDKVDKSFTDIDGYIENIVLEDAKFQEDMSASLHTMQDASSAAIMTFSNWDYQGYPKILYTSGFLSRLGRTAVTLAATQGTVDKSTEVEKELVEKLPYLVDNLSAIPVTEQAKNDAVALTFGEDNVVPYNTMKEDYKKTSTDAFLNKYGEVLPAYGVNVPEGTYYSPKANASVAKTEKDGSLESVIYARYIVVPTPHQVNILIKKENNIEQSREIISVLDLIPENNKISLTDIREDGYPEAKPINYYTNTKFENTDPYKVPSSDNVKTGTGEDVKQPILDMPLEETVYVFWEIDTKNPPPPPVETGYVVPQWRLSKYWNHLIADDGHDLTGTDSMSFSVSRSCCDCGCSPYLSGSWSYTMVNPNGSCANSGLDLVSQMKYRTYLHSKALDEGKISYPSLGSPRGSMHLSGNLNAIKSTDKSGLKLATWLNPAISAYDIEGSTNPLRKSESIYKTSDLLPYGFYNTNKFYNGYYVCGCYDEDDDDGGSTHVHQCGFGLNVIAPSDPSYDGWQTGINVTFKRYLQQAKDKLVVSPVVTSENGLTTLKYQLKDTLNVYPEYGMLLQEDNGHESLKWVVGDENRQISPVVYQTLQHKVYVSPVTSGTSVATDSRAITNAAKLGEGNKQVIYKGSAMGNAFAIYQDSNMKSAGLLTAKTFALDIKDSVKSAWGDGSYNSYAQHQTLLDSLNGEKAAYDEHLLIDSPNYGSVDYTGGSIKGFSPEGYTLRKYNGEDKVTLEHELIVRGGKLVAVRVQDTNGSRTLKTVEELKAENNGSKTSLYAALVNMNLIDESGNKENTVFKAFEHLTGDVLTEGTYATLLKNARNTVDGKDVSSSVEVKEGQGWYSEDTTVLVVKEYISNFTVPGVSVSDKIALSVNGLVTPQNKAQFFSQMGKGYLHLNYDITCNKAIYEGLLEIHSWFTYTSYPSDEYAFGKQETQYLVPNVSITDTTRLN